MPVLAVAGNVLFLVHVHAVEGWLAIVIRSDFPAVTTAA
jgi:hypothetical protein